MQNDKAKIKNGFALVEMIIVLFMITIITALVLVNYRQGERRLTLQNAARQLVLDIRRAQNMALQAAEYGGVVPDSYGIYMTTSTSYILFADCAGGITSTYDSLEGTCGSTGIKPEKIEKTNLPKNIQISNLSPLSPGNRLDITFEPPDPTICIYNGVDCSTISATITLINTAATLPPVNIIVTKSGLVGIQ